MSPKAHLFSPLKLSGITLPNRIAVSPMCQYSCNDGFATDWHLVHLGSRAAGGAGLVIAEASGVSPEGRITPGDLGIYKDAHIQKLRQIVEFVHTQGAYAGIQLAHAGRKACMDVPWKPEGLLTPSAGGWENTAAPSAMRFADNYTMPNELDRAGMKQVIFDFVAAAKRALAAGFNVVEIHGAHGYLLHEFYSPLSNRRTDEYGGSFENRIRLLVEVVDAVRAVWPHDRPLFVRISATDWTEGGWDGEQSVELAKVLKDHGVDLMDISSGGNVQKAEIPVGPGYQTPFAEQIRREGGILTGAVGMITNAVQADQIVRNGQADLILLARELLRDPYWPLHAADELKQKASWPTQYLRAAHHDTPARSPINS